MRLLVGALRVIFGDRAISSCPFGNLVAIRRASVAQIGCSNRSCTSYPFVVPSSAHYMGDHKLRPLPYVPGELAAERRQRDVKM